MKKLVHASGKNVHVCANTNYFLEKTCTCAWENVYMCVKKLVHVREKTCTCA